MTKKKFVKFDDLMDELKQKDPDSYNEIIEHSKALTEKINSEECFYVKDREGYVCKRPKSEITEEHTIITEKEYDKISGLGNIKKKIGGYRANSGRKKSYKEKVKETYELEKSDVTLLKEYAQIHKLSKNKVISLAIHKLIESDMLFQNP